MDLFRTAVGMKGRPAPRPTAVEAILKDGAERARAEARKTMELVRTAVGIKGRPA